MTIWHARDAATQNVSSTRPWPHGHVLSFERLHKQPITYQRLSAGAWTPRPVPWQRRANCWRLDVTVSRWSSTAARTCYLYTSRLYTVHTCTQYTCTSYTRAYTYSLCTHTYASCSKSFKRLLHRVNLLSQPRGICNRRCLFVCLSVSNFAQKLLNEFSWNFQGRLAMGQ